MRGSIATSSFFLQKSSFFAIMYAYMAVCGYEKIKFERQVREMDSCDSHSRGTNEVEDGHICSLITCFFVR